MTRLPIDDVLDKVSAALKSSGAVVLHAPPGAGKTTRVPLHLLESGVINGRILMLEPRRVAARTSAERMAAGLGEKPGETVGYAMRGARKVGPATKIEVVTEGILTRMIQSDAELAGVGCVIFDEFHERSIHADLGLALVLEVRGALRPDLKLVVMSATLDEKGVSELIGNAPVIRSQGKAFDVETIWLDRPWSPEQRRGRRYCAGMADLVSQAHGAQGGSVLVFLPGVSEISGTQNALGNRLGTDTDIVPLYGALPFKAQMEALRPAQPGRRKVVLATSLAETSLTIPDVKIVVDGGLARRPRFDPGSGMVRLQTERVTRAEATQRQGRAGRVSAGVCYRAWTKGEEGGLRAFPPVEILDNDLLGLALELAKWGARDATDLPFLTPPPAKALDQARSLLRQFGALDPALRLTPHGADLMALPLHPRLANMIAGARRAGCETTAMRLALCLDGRPSPHAQGVDIAARLKALASGKDPRSQDIRAELKRLSPKPDTKTPDIGGLLSLAYPDRIAMRRAGKAPRYLMSGGKGAVLADSDLLAGAPFLAVADLDGDMREAKIRQAAHLDRATLDRFHGNRMSTVHRCAWDARTHRVVAQVQTCLDALVLEAQTDPKPDPDLVLGAVLDGIRLLGLEALSWSKPAKLLVARVRWTRSRGADLPDFGAEALLDHLEDWLGPYLAGVTSKEALAKFDPLPALKAHLGWDGQTQLDAFAPRAFTTPTGSTVSINYAGDQPKISVRLQEMLGVTAHPVMGPNKMPLLIELLSPAQRPIQTTADLPGFWATSYADLRKDMRGQYPKHVWPEDPANAAPTRRAKPR